MITLTFKNNTLDLSTELGRRAIAYRIASQLASSGMSDECVIPTTDYQPQLSWYVARDKSWKLTFEPTNKNSVKLIHMLRNFELENHLAHWLSHTIGCAVEATEATVLPLSSIQIDADAFKKKLEHRGYTPESTTEILDVLCEGLPLKSVGAPFSIQAGNMSVVFFDSKGNPSNNESVVHNRNFELHINGVNQPNVCEISLPTLSAASNELLTVDLKIFPFNIYPLIPGSKENQDNEHY